jgi:murein L,D-transpeptidase YafK
MTWRKVVTGTMVLTIALGIQGLLNRLGYTMPTMALPAGLCFNRCQASELMHIPPDRENMLNGDQKITDLLDISDTHKQNVSVLIEKAKYRLTVYLGRQPIKSYPIVLGTAPTGDKLQEGDRKTPEGIFRIRELSPHPIWSKFLWLDYPTTESWQKHWQAKLSRKLDSAATIGGEIGIHGVPEGSDTWVDQRQNWTWGCISLKNKDVDELYSVVQVDTVVEIVP